MLQMLELMPNDADAFFTDVPPSTLPPWTLPPSMPQMSASTLQLNIQLIKLLLLIKPIQSMQLIKSIQSIKLVSRSA